jgi:hypothetical protein
MPRQSNGVDIQPANTAAVSGTSISSAAFNTLVADIYAEITNSIDRGGRSAMTASLPMGNQKITNMADPAVATDGATKNYVDLLLAALYSTGDGKITLKSVADTGWVMCDDGTIGCAASGSSTRANADTQALFTLLFNNMNDTWAPIFTSGGGATTRAAQTNAASAWAANCRMSLTKVMGRAISGAGSGSGLSGRPLGAYTGTETVALIRSDLPNVAPIFSGINDPVSVTSTLSDWTRGVIANGTGPGTGAFVAAQGAVGSTGTFTPRGTIQDINGGVGQTAHSNVQPTSFWNVMVKL